MALLHRFSRIFVTFCGTFSLVHGNLCAFGCREFPQHQIVSSAQFRSFIMPRERGDCAGGDCCGGIECADTTQTSGEEGEGYAETGRTPNTDNGEEAEETTHVQQHKSAIPDIATFLKALLPRHNAENVDQRTVWYSTAAAAEVNRQRQLSAEGAPK